MPQLVNEDVAEDYCCKWLAFQATTACSQHPQREDCADTVIHHYPGSWGLPVHDGGSGYIEISHCPGCGSPLPQ